jgi:hypothetical protein
MTRHKCPDCGVEHTKPQTDKERIDELERRVKELEERPAQFVPLPYPVVPYTPPPVIYPRPWHEPYPWIVTTGTISIGSSSPVIEGTVYNS